MSDTESGALRARAIQIAKSAGDGILARRGAIDRSAFGFKGVRDLVTEADLESERLIVTALREEFPDHEVLAEEEVSAAAEKAVRGEAASLDPGKRPVSAATDLEPLRERVAAAEHCWLIDPLDGTTNFAHSHPFFSVSMALYRRGEPWLGVVYAPALGELFVALKGAGATLNDRPLNVSRTELLQDSMFATGFPYRRHELSDLENNIGPMNRFLREVRGFRRGGSAAIDLSYVAAGRFDFYFEAQLEPWDVAAGALIVREAGGTVTDYDAGEDWLCGRRILASNGPLHEIARARLR